MYNQVFLVGRLAQMPDYEIINNYRKDALIHIMVYRPFDEVKGCRDYDLVPIILWRGLAEMINDTCHVGSVIAVKGRLNTDTLRWATSAWTARFTNRERLNSFQ